ncbi:AfsA-related hotdog domain-containing protein [Streptomyces sp. NPDC101225]|uniref:AfsA-related hotdog domain-containing protein n=1 Tax=Streptomyces sp. NPDC101225 TaxID=3366135 RepID=UPI0037F9D64D
MLGSAVDEPTSAQEPAAADGPLSWRSLGLEAMASMLVVWLRRRGNRSFEAQCQWPRMHPLNERTPTVAHHPLIIVESTRQLAAAVRHRHLPATRRGTACEAMSVSLGLRPGAQPAESGSATHVPVRVTLSDLVPGPGGLDAFRVTAEFLHAGQQFATCTMTFAAPARRPAGAPAAAPGAGLLHPAAAAVGAVADSDVLLARAPQGRLVIVPRDPAHPVLLPGRPSLLPAVAVLEAGRQAVLLSSGMTAGAVVGLQTALRSPVPDQGAAVDVAADHRGARFVVTTEGCVAATGAVSLLRS